MHNDVITAISSDTVDLKLFKSLAPVMSLNLFEASQPHHLWADSLEDMGASTFHKSKGLHARRRDR
jgi:hypothetical protein